MTTVWLRNVGDDEDDCWVPCASVDAGATAFVPENHLPDLPQEAPDAEAEGLKRYPPRDPGKWDIDLNRHSRNCFVEGFKVALALSRPKKGPHT